MGFLHFIDPRSGKEIELRRDNDNPFYERIEAFRKSAPTALWFVSDGARQIARTAYVFPADFPLVAAPAIKLEVIQDSGNGHQQVHGRMGYFTQSRKAAFPSHLQLDFGWINDVWKQHLRPLLYDDLECSRVNYLAEHGSHIEFDVQGEESGPVRFSSFSKNIRKRQHPHPGLSNPKESELSHLVYLKICLAWPYWEQQNVPWKARHSEAAVMGICREMQEDNFRKICKTAGFLVPRSAKEMPPPNSPPKRK